MLLATILRRLTLTVISMLFLTMLLPLNILPLTVFAQGSTAVINPSQAMPGTQVTGTGSSWVSGDSMLVQWEDGTTLANTKVRSDGTFSVPFIVSSNATVGSHTVYFVDQTASYFIPATLTVGTVDLQTLTIIALQSPYVGFSPTFRAYIQNKGNIASGFFDIQWIADGKNYYGGHYSIAAGAIDTHDFIWNSVLSGQHTLMFIANFDHGVIESNYNNNKATINFTPQTASYDPSTYAGKSGFVSTGSYNEPNDYKHRNYCGPGASQALISAWTSNVPNIDKLGTQEKTDPQNGTLMLNMVTPINNAIGQSYYSVHYANANLQGDFSKMIGQDILDNHHPLITGILTMYGKKKLNGWTVAAKHIITIYGFDFSSPTVGYIYYYETSGTVAGTTATGPNAIDYNVFWSLVQQNDIQLS